MPAPGREDYIILKGSYADRDAEVVRSFRHRWAERVQRQPELLDERFCTNCDAKLSRWNLMTICFPCERQERLNAG
jgi:hypothetical protein